MLIKKQNVIYTKEKGQETDSKWSQKMMIKDGDKYFRCTCGSYDFHQEINKQYGEVIVCNHCPAIYKIEQAEKGDVVG